MRQFPVSNETYALIIMGTLTAAGLILPHIVQPESYHHFADQRALAGIPHFADVVSNLIFTVAGAAGLARLRALLPSLRAARLPLATFFLGLALTGLGSSFYHWAPSTPALFWDRLPMVIAFAGVIGTFLTQRVSERAGLIGLVWSLAMGGAGLAASQLTGNLAMYLTLQFGGLAGLLAGLFFVKSKTDPLPWWSLIGWYALAKVLELADSRVWELTSHTVSGHTLKHLAAGMAGVAVVRLLYRPAVDVTRKSRTQEGAAEMKVVQAL